MMNLVCAFNKHISARSNPWVQQWLRWQTKPAERRAAGYAWLEGEHLVWEAIHRARANVDASAAPAAFTIAYWVLTDTLQGHALHAKLCAAQRWAASVPTIWLTESVYAALSTLGSASSAVSAVIQPAQSQTLNPQQAAVVLDGVQDPGNVGTLIRLCASFGMPQVLLSNGCASAWGEKALRAGQGAQLALAVHEGVDLAAAYTQFAAQGLTIAVTRLDANAIPLLELTITPRMVWVFGNEGQGVSAASVAAASACVYIPMVGGFESLNVAAAAAVCLWEWQKVAAQRGFLAPPPPA